MTRIGETSSACGRERRPRVFWLGLLLLPVLFFVTCEGLARLVPARLVSDDPNLNLLYVPEFFERVSVGGSEHYRVAHRELYRERAVTFSAQKARDGFRVFCLGGSASAGWPHPAGEDWCAQLAPSLTRALPDKQVDVGLPRHRRHDLTEDTSRHLVFGLIPIATLGLVALVSLRMLAAGPWELAAYLVFFSMVIVLGLVESALLRRHAVVDAWFRPGWLFDLLRRGRLLVFGKVCVAVALALLLLVEVAHLSAGQWLLLGLGALALPATQRLIERDLDTHLEPAAAPVVAREWAVWCVGFVLLAALFVHNLYEAPPRDLNRPLLEVLAAASAELGQGDGTLARMVHWGAWREAGTWWLIEQVRIGAWQSTLPIANGPILVIIYLCHAIYSLAFVHGMLRLMRDVPDPGS